jgi:hypothetical protein
MIVTSLLDVYFAGFGSGVIITILLYVGIRLAINAIKSIR